MSANSETLLSVSYLPQLGQDAHVRSSALDRAVPKEHGLKNKMDETTLQQTKRVKCGTI